MTRIRTRGMPFACSMALIAACGSSNSGGAESLAEAYCAEMAKCCAQAHLTNNGQLCHSMFSGSYPTEAASACLAEVKTQAAAGTFCSSTDSSSPACTALFKSTSNGNKKPGDACTVDSDCAPSNDGKVACASQHNRESSAWINKCQVQMRGKVGDACLGTQDGAVFSSTTLDATDISPRGYVCDTADGIECTSGSCVALVPLGQPCGYSSDCIRTAYCDRTDHCTARISAGGTCTGADSDECVAGYYCPEGSPRQCTAQVGTFASCTSDTMCTSDNCDGETCQPGLLETVGWALICS